MSVATSRSGGGALPGPVEIRVCSAGSGDVALLSLAGEEEP